MDAKILFGDIVSLQAALNCIQANIFIANRDFKLIYMNPKAEKTLKNIENAIFKVFSIKTEDFIGESIHRFHRDPSRVESILRNPLALPQEATFEFGNIHLKSSINSIVGPENEVIGYIVNWEDVSEKVKLLEDLSKKAALDVDMAKLLLDLRNIEGSSDNP